MGGGLLDLDPADPDGAAAAALLDEVWRPDPVEDQIAWRNGERSVARLVRRDPPAGVRPGTPPPVRADGTYLITGGLGGLGLKVARWLAGAGAGHLVLAGRQGLPERRDWPAAGETPATAPPAALAQMAAIREIEALGAAVTVVAADVADAAAMAALFRRFGDGLPPLRGVVHAAVAMSALPVRDLSAAAVRAMLRAKVGGGWVLHTLTAGLDLDFFVLFSSTTALWGARDLAHYAAANQFLDALAHLRRAAGLPALAVDWGTWDEMRVASLDERAAVAQFGLHPLPAAAALDALGELLAAPAPTQVAIAAVDWGVLKPAYEARRPRPFLSRVGGRPPASPSAGAPGAPRSDLLERIAAAPPEARRDVLAAHVRTEVALALGRDPARPIDPDQGLFDLGMDSLMSVELKSRLEAGVGRPLPSTLTFNYSTIAALTDYLATQVLELNGPTAAASSAPSMLAPEPSASASTDDLTEDELADLLMARLSQLK